MIANVCGIVERVNKLISVRPMKSRYYAKIGDVVVGRVLSVGKESADFTCSFRLVPGMWTLTPSRMRV